MFKTILNIPDGINGNWKWDTYQEGIMRPLNRVDIKAEGSHYDSTHSYSTNSDTLLFASQNQVNEICRENEDLKIKIETLKNENKNIREQKDQILKTWNEECNENIKLKQKINTLLQSSYKLSPTVKATPLSHVENIAPAVNSKCTCTPLSVSLSSVNQSLFMDLLSKLHDALCCPLSQTLLETPVITPLGDTFSKESFKNHIISKGCKDMDKPDTFLASFTQNYLSDSNVTFRHPFVRLKLAASQIYPNKVINEILKIYNEYCEVGNMKV
ncbi:unnamed protein product [Moneuplotes crassus]|uniref:U-box domain-containing protein n=1 Tax=Euplotes crassus TaxID=5936 RepID=A0AAD1UMA8_EUPCR|nr:unnamed protein product [Moneuplotes crassus]